jgi:hypothetical protein
MTTKKNTNMIKKYLDTKSSESAQYVYIKHINNTQIYKLPFSTTVHSKLLRDTILENMTSETYGKIETNPMIINNYTTGINHNSMVFVLNYMKYYDNKIETPAPDAPIKNIHISLIIGDGYKLFDNIYDKDTPLKESIISINKLIEASLYFNIKHLDKKLCAITASLILNSNINELKSIS